MTELNLKNLKETINSTDDEFIILTSFENQKLFHLLQDPFNDCITFLIRNDKISKLGVQGFFIVNPGVDSLSILTNSSETFERKAAVLVFKNHKLTHFEYIETFKNK